MKNFGLALILLGLVFSLGCGNSNNNGPTPSGNFSNASLSGSYAYQFTGFDLNTGNSYVRAGVFTANGAGGITSGSDDFSEGLQSTSATTGTYAVGNDGTGTMTLTLPSGSLNLVITLQSANKVYIVEGDTGLTGYGIAEKQNAGSITTIPSGTFVFKQHSVDINNLTPTSSVGLLTILGGAASGSEDLNTLGLGALPVTITGGAVTAPAVNGRGTATISDNTPFTHSIVYYVIDTNTFLFFNSDPGFAGVGRAERQSGAFTNASLSGNYAFQLRGDTFSNFSGLHTVGRYSADGAGNISNGVFDTMLDGVSTSNAPLTGTYTVAGSGRAVLTLNSSTQQIYYMVSPTRAFVMVNDLSKAAEGTVDIQSSGAFTKASTNGQFGFLMDGISLNTGFTIDRVGTLQFDGNGNLILNEFVNQSGGTNFTGFLPGTYTTSGNGRVTGTINTGAGNLNLLFYLISGNNAYALENTTGTEVDGVIQLQQ